MLRKSFDFQPIRCIHRHLSELFFQPFLTPFRYRDKFHVCRWSIRLIRLYTQRICLFIKACFIILNQVIFVHRIRILFYYFHRCPHGSDHMIDLTRNRCIFQIDHRESTVFEFTPFFITV